MNPETDPALLSFDERRDRRASPFSLSVRTAGRRIISGLPPSDACVSLSRSCFLMWSGDGPSSVHTLVKEKGLYSLHGLTPSRLVALQRVDQDRRH